MNEVLNFFQEFYKNHKFWSWVLLIVGFPEIEIVVIIGIILGFLFGK